MTPKQLRSLTGDDLVRRALCVLRAAQCKMTANFESGCFPAVFVAQGWRCARSRALCPVFRTATVRRSAHKRKRAGLPKEPGSLSEHSVLATYSEVAAAHAAAVGVTTAAAAGCLLVLRTIGN